jgi:hypothetical protein
MVVDIPEPTAGSISSSAAGGDGFEPLIIGRRVFNLYHHSGAAVVVCTQMDNGAFCPNYGT